MRTARAFRAPGRVNLMGDHTDYNDGFVLPMAIHLECVVRMERQDTGRVRARSVDLEPDRTVDLAADGADDPTAVEPEWARYLAGVIRVLAERGRPPVGLDAIVSSTVPIGSGLSSSAALEVACALALCDAAEWPLEPQEVALACQAAEQLSTGVPSGIMDQLASVAGQEGAALLIDCRSLDVEAVPLPPDVRVLIVHSGVPRTLVGSAYAERRAGCEALAARLGLRALRDATLEQVEHDPLGRHVVTENQRVFEAADALRAADLPRVGAVFSASHASLRDDYRVSSAELDALVEELEAAGALGARLTGAGFGGCVVAMCDPDEVERVAETATARYAERTGLVPTPYVSTARAGAGILRTEEATE